jgi:transducin (beta)-like 1
MDLKGATPSSAADGTLATCSADNSINLLRMGDNKPLKILRGHTDEVNAIRFDPTGKYLASVSDDMTARVWSLDVVLGPNYIGLSNGGSAPSVGRSQGLGKRGSATPRAPRGGSNDQMDVDDDEDRADNDSHNTSIESISHGENNGNTSSNSNSILACKHVLSGHKKDIFAIAWAPHDLASEEPRLLATASFDNTARIWNADDGTCLRIFQEHTDSVYSVCFSPDRRFLVTGGMDHRLFVSSVADGSVVMAYAGGGGIFDIAWHVNAAKKSAAAGSTDGSKGRVKQESSNAATSSSSLPRRHHLALSQANRMLTILDVTTCMDSSTSEEESAL